MRTNSKIKAVEQNFITAIGISSQPFDDVSFTEAIIFDTFSKVVPLRIEIFRLLGYWLGEKLVDCNDKWNGILLCCSFMDQFIGYMVYLPLTLNQICYQVFLSLIGLKYYFCVIHTILHCHFLLPARSGQQLVFWGR